MEELDLNYTLVLEVFEFVNEGDFLQGFLASQKDQFAIETDFERAKDYAFEQLINHASLDWVSIREIEHSKINKKLYQFPNHPKLSDKIYEMEEPFFKTIKSRIPTKYQDVDGEVAADMGLILENRLINGLTGNLFEQMFQVYKRGGWPCGWKGNYPEGQMIVFSPSS